MKGSADYENLSALLVHCGSAMGTASHDLQVYVFALL